MKKRFWALLLAVMMVVSVLPTSAFAVDAEGKVTARKMLVCDGAGNPIVDADGCYTIKLTVQGNPVTTSVQPNADVVLVVDNSGSMGTSVGTPCGEPKESFTESDGFLGLYKVWTCPACGMRYTSSLAGWLWDERPDNCIGEKGTVVRMDAAKEVSKEFAESILQDSTGNKMAVIGFAHGDKKGGANDADAIRVQHALTNNLSDVKSKIDTMYAEGGTNYSAALQKAYDYLNGRSPADKANRPGYVIFISDGAPGRSGESLKDSDWNGENQIAALKAAGITVYTVGIALEEGPAEYLKNMASDEKTDHFINVKGENYKADLSDILAEWAAQIKKVPAGTNAVMTDVVDTDKFDIVADGYAGLTLGEDKKTLTWEIGNIPETVQEKTIKIKPKTGVYGNDIPTNKDVNLTYLPAGETTKYEKILKEQIGDPTVTIAPPATTYTLTYHNTATVRPATATIPAAVTGIAYNGGVASLTAATTAETAKDGIPGTWRFDGWYLNENLTEDAVTSVSNITANVNVYAKWTFTPDTYTLTYHNTATVRPATATIPEAVTGIAYNGSVDSLADATTTETAKDGIPGTWRFDGWYLNENLTEDAVTSVSNITANVNVYAKWTFTPDTYTLTYHNTATVRPATATIPEAVTGIAYNGSVDSLAVATTTETAKDGIPGTWSFDGWYLNENLTGDAVTSVSNITADVNVYAKWTFAATTYTVTYYDEDGSTQLGTGTYHYGEDVTVPADPTKAADATNTYTFDKWVLVSGAALRDGKCQGNAVYKASYSVIPREAQLSVTSKVMKTAGEIKAGDTITWTITVSNSGNKDAAVTASMIADKIYYRDNDNSAWTELTGTGSDVTFPSSLPVTVEAGKSIDIDVTWVVPDSMAGKWIKNAAKINDGKDPGAETEPVFAVPTPGLSVTKTVNKTSVTVGDTVKYTITVKNTGNVDLTNVNVVEAFGGDFSKITNVTGADLVTKNGFVIRELKAGSDPVEITFSYKTTKRETLTNSVVVEGTYEPGKTVENEAKSPDVTVKSEPITPVGPSKPQLNYEDHYAYVVGYPDGLVHPERNITRAEVATIFFRMLLDESREYFWAQENDFSDVAETDWFNNAVSTLANAQLINGYPDGSYRPNANITRAEFATIAIRFFLDEDVEIEENNLSDVKGHWAEANINLAYALELINGYPDGTFRPDQKITRAEAMAIVNRVLKRAPEKDHLLKDMIEWPDNLNTAAWYYADVQEATNSHKFHMDKEEEYEIWTELLPVRDWVALEQEWSKANSSKNPGEVVDIKITTPEAGDNGLKLD